MGSIEKEVIDVHAKTVSEGAALVALQEQQSPTAGGMLQLSPAQERIWFLEQMEPGNPTNLRSRIFHLNGKVEYESLRRALDEVLRRHETLRTTFAAAAIYAGVDGLPVPIIAESTATALRIVNLAHLSSDERESTVADLMKPGASQRFDLSKGPLHRTTLLRLSDNEHLLLLSMHCMIADESSCVIFIQDLFRFYQSFVDNSPLEMEPLTIQYSAIARRQHSWLQTGAAKDRINDWKELLRGIPELLELPADKPRPPKLSYAGARASIDVSGRVADALENLSQRVNSNLSALLLSAFQALLARYTSRTDIVLGISVPGRTAETKSLIGPLSNSVVLRTKVATERSFLEQVERTSESLAVALSLQEVPFERLVDELHPQRSLSHTPVFQVMFRTDDSGPVTYELPDLRVCEIDRCTEVCEFDLSLSLRLPAHREETLKVSLDYNTDLFDAGTIERLLRNFMSLLEGVLANPEQRLSAVQLIHAEERQQLISWNETEQEYEREACVHELIERQAALHAAEVALVFGERQLSYEELNGRANQLAAYLSGRLDEESLVGIYLDRGPEMVIAVLAVLKAGAAYVPLAPEQPAARLGYMIADAGLRLIITQPDLRERLPGGVAVVSLEDEAEAIAAESGENVRGSASAQSLAYVIYTSGSTGAPKAVEIRHAAVVNFLTAMQKRPGLSARDRLLAVTTLSFDIAALELYLPLTVGASVELVSGAQASDGPYLKQKLEGGGISALQATPATWRLLVEAGWEGKAPVKILCGGEALPRELANELLRRAPSVWNLYGPTETTIWSAVGELTETDGPVLLGEPIANTQLYVLDEGLQLAPIGVAGELYIGGAGLARGYHGRAALTAERFLPNPYARAAGERMYRTGDLVRRMTDGRLEFLGRLDHQVKIRGFRIETGEIESLLRQHPAVRDTVVVVREESGEKRLVAYLVLQRKQTVATEELRAHVQQSLPDYMIPSAFVVLDELPLTASGKVDRRRLPQPNDERPALVESFVAPRTPIEHEVAKIWEQVLKVREVGVFDNFFALGGHSLLATRVISRVNESLQAEVPLRAIFEHPTVAGVALAAAGHQASDQEIRLRPRTPGDSVPLSFGQERMWFLNTLEPDNPFYNIPRVFRLSGELDVGALERALGEIVRRHESLRTRFESVGGVPRQVIDEAGEWRLKLVDLSGKEAPEREAEAQRLAQEEGQRPFALAREWGLRAQLLRLSEREHILLLTMHHIVSDGWSLGVLFGELQRLYEGYERGEGSPLPELGLQYADFAVWQREWLGATELQKQLSYWKEQLGGASRLELPHDRARPAAPSYRGEKQWLQLTAELSEQLQALARAEGVTLFMVLLAAFQVLLSRYSGQTDISVGTPIANRKRAQLEELIGFFVNTLVLRTELGGDPSFVELLGRVREVALAAYAHQDLPFEKLVEELQPERSLSRNPLFDVLFAVQNAPRSEGRLGELRLERWGEGSKTTRVDLEVHVWEGTQGLGCMFVYATELFGAETMQRLMAHYEQLLRAVVADAGQRLSELPLLTSAEEEQLRQWNETSSGYPEQCIQELFEAQAEQRGGAVAVRCGGAELSYGELNERANQLAHYLRGQGVGAETRVGLCVERSLELVVGLLGILKAGGAYVPLDPVYPEARLKYMVADAGVRLLLTQRGLVKNWQGSGLQIVALDGGQELAGQERSNPSLITKPDNLAYVIYTSGSTGKPKGVLVSNQSVVHLVSTLQSQINFTSRDVWTCAHSYGFDFSVWEIYGSLLSGGRLIVVPGIVTQSPSEMINLLRAEHITIFSQTPSSIRQLISKTLLTKGQTFDLRLIACGGEALPQSLATDLLQLQVPVWNFYGPTEATVWATIKHVQSEDTSLPLISIGRPFANIQIYIVDSRLEPVPIGIVGELCISGVGLARGYSNSTELTAEKFVPNPFSGNGARMYCTGDLARYLPDGNIEFLGRRDNQVKVRGFRIEIAEIESSLRQHPAVREAVVTVSDANVGEHRLVAYLVQQADQKISVNELRIHLQQSLPDYMIPSAFVVLDTLPLTASGKVDRRRLPAPDEKRPELGETYVAPRTPLEQEIARIWELVLKVKQVGVHDNFFALGGHSLLATQVISRVNESLQIEMPLRAMFEQPTVAGLALAAAQRQAITLEDEAVQLLTELSQLSDEEAQELLESEF